MLMTPFQRTSHEIDPVSLRVVMLTYAIVMIGLGVLILSAPLPILFDRFIPDDAFYYYNTARIFAQTGFSSFDGIHFTNGYQPLWFLVHVPIFWLFPGGEIPIQLSLSLQLALATITTVIAFKLIARLFGILSAAITGAVWILVFQRVMLNGLETALQMLLYVVLFALYLRWLHNRQLEQDYRATLALGIVCGLLFLARTDSVFLVASIFVSLFLRKPIWRFAGRCNLLTEWLVFAIPVATLAGAYLTVNIIMTGHLMPVSGAAKQFHSEVARQAAIAHTNDPWRVYLENIIWAFTQPGYRFLGLSLVGPWTLLLLSWLTPLRRNLSSIRYFWPFYLGALASFLYYALAFYGSFTRTLWYYGPHAFLAWFVLSCVSQSLDELPIFRNVPGLSAVLGGGLILGWASALQVGYILAIAVIVVFIGTHLQLKSKATNLAMLGLGTIGALALFYFLGVNLKTWLIISISIICIGGLVLQSVTRRWREAFISVMMLFAFSAIHMANLIGDLTTKPGNWNYNLYLGALWAREHLPADATIWSGSAGILGYFSERRVVNTDGLANSYDFLENTLKTGQLGTYYRKWDYAIDAFVDESLNQYFPEGCFVPLPVDLERFSFNDGMFTRRLMVFQMKQSGVVECPDTP